MSLQIGPKINTTNVNLETEPLILQSENENEKKNENEKNPTKKLDRTIAMFSWILVALGVIGLCISLGITAMQKNLGNIVTVPFWSPYVWTETAYSLYSIIGRIPHIGIQLPLIISLGGFLPLFLRDLMVGIHTQIHGSENKFSKKNILYRFMNYTDLIMNGLHPVRYFTSAVVVSITDIAIFGALQMQWGEFQVASVVITMLGIAMLSVFENISMRNEKWTKMWAVLMAWLTTVWLLIPWIIFWTVVPPFKFPGVAGFFWTMMSFRVLWTVCIPFPIVWRAYYINTSTSEKKRN